MQVQSISPKVSLCEAKIGEDFDIGSCLKQLSDEEFSDSQRILPSKKNNWVSGRLAAKRLVRESVSLKEGVVPSWSDVVIKSNGIKPSVKLLNSNFRQLESLSLSISHTEGLSVAAISTDESVGAIGVDLEKIREFSKSTLREFMTKCEYSEYVSKQSGDRNEYATRIWCIKEAYLKASGVGLQIHPRKIRVSEDDSSQICVYKDDIKVESLIRCTKRDNLYIIALIEI